MQSRRPEAQYETIDGAFCDRYDDPFKVQIERQPGPELTVQTEISGEQISYESVYAARVPRPKKKRKRTVTQQAYDKARVSAANGWILAWVGFWYFTVQLPFAFISTVGLGIAAYVYTLVSSFTENGGFLVGVAEATVGLEVFQNAVEAVVRLAGRFFGLTFDPLLLFFLPWVAVFTLGAMQLILAWFIYSIMGLRPLSGRASTAKVLTFLLALIGTIVPVLNLFPLTVVWCAVVWWRPK